MMDDREYRRFMTEALACQTLKDFRRLIRAPGSPIKIGTDHNGPIVHVPPEFKNWLRHVAEEKGNEAVDLMLDYTARVERLMRREHRAALPAHAR